MPKSTLMPDDGYRELLEELKTRIRSSQLRAAISMLSRFRMQLRPWSHALSLLAIALATQSVRAEEITAYCDSTFYAINVYQENSPDASEPSLRIRVFWREKSLIFADLPAQSSRFPEGFVYSSESRLLGDRYSDSLWTLFVPDEEGQACLLFRNGAAFASGTVTRRQSDNDND